MIDTPFIDKLARQPSGIFVTLTLNGVYYDTVMLMLPVASGMPSPIADNAVYNNSRGSGLSIAAAGIGPFDWTYKGDYAFTTYTAPKPNSYLAPGSPKQKD